MLSVTKNAVLCLNLCDEAEKNGIKIDCDELSLNLGIPVVKTCATDKKGLDELKKAIYNVCSGKTKCFRVLIYYPKKTTNRILKSFRKLATKFQVTA